MRAGDGDLEDRLLKDADEGRFQDIYRNALEGRASRKLDLELLVERRAWTQELSLVPETIARFVRECAGNAAFPLKPLGGLLHAMSLAVPR